MRFGLVLVSLLALAGCAKSVVVKTQSAPVYTVEQLKAMQYVAQVNKDIVAYYADKGAARYEVVELDAVQTDLDTFDIDSPTTLEDNLDKLSADVGLLVARDNVVCNQYLL